MESAQLSPYLRLIQRTGGTRHPGGLTFTDVLLSRANLDKNSRVLDVGCGAGHTSAHIAKIYGCTVHGVDISKDALDRARDFYKKEPFFDRLSFEVSNAESLPFSDGYFDVVLCESVLIFIKDKNAAVKEMARLVKKKGYFALNELCISTDDDMDRFKDFFNRPEFGGYLTTANAMFGAFINDAWKVIVKDEQPFSMKQHLKSEISHFGTFKGLLQLLEAGHQMIFNKDVRSDLFEVFKLSFDKPKGLNQHLRTLLFLARKMP